MKILFLTVLMYFVFLTAAASQCYDLYFEGEYRSPHYGRMVVYRNGTASLTVKFPNGNGGWNCVYQVGKLVRYRQMNGAEFYNPVVCGTSITNRYYSPDNIYWWTDQYGNLYLYNLDDRAVMSNAWIRLVPCN